MNDMIKNPQKRSSVKDIFIAAFVVIFMAYIIIYPEKSVDFVIKALNLCYLIIIPAIFPFLIISQMFFSSPLFDLLGRLLNKPAKFLFDIQGEYINAFLLGSIAGFPLGAKSVVKIYAANPHTKNEAERTLAFCNNCSAPFVITVVGIAVFGRAAIGGLLFCLQLISALLTGIIIRVLFKNRTDITAKSQRSGAENKADLTSIVSDAVNGILNICGIIIFFYITINISLEIFSSLPFITDNQALVNGLKIAVSGILELSSGIYSLVHINLPAAQKLMIASAILAWSGISVHCQIIYVLKDIGLSLKPYFTGKIIHVIISVVLTKILFSFDDISVMCQSAYSFSVTSDRGFILTGIASGITAVIIGMVLWCGKHKANIKPKNR